MSAAEKLLTFDEAAMTGYLAAMVGPLQEAIAACDRFGHEAQAAAAVLEREFGHLRAFAVEIRIETAIVRRFRRQLRLRRDRKNWRVRKP